MTRRGVAEESADESAAWLLRRFRIAHIEIVIRQRSHESKCDRRRINLDNLWCIDTFAAVEEVVAGIR
jgi:hypothetical protein